MTQLDDLREFIHEYSTAPRLADMPRRSLADKGIQGPTGAHVIEEIHTPFNFAYLTVTTGSTAFQNLVGVTQPEIPSRIAASIRAFEMAGIPRGARVLITYPPLVNVFPAEALTAYGIDWFFLPVSSRDALVLELCESKPEVVVGESSFLRAALADADKLGLTEELPTGVKFLCAGTPLDLELLPVAAKLCGGQVHDLYGCQEFGWLMLDGIPLRDDITLAPAGEGYVHLLAGGLPTGDFFPFSENGHICNPNGRVITYSRRRGSADWEVTVLASTAAGRETVERLAKSILRIKAKIVRIADDLQLNAPGTVLFAAEYGADAKTAGKSCIIAAEQKTKLFDELLAAQLTYQSQGKQDPSWIKGR